VTDVVATANVALFWPEATVTEEGTDATKLLLDNPTVKPEAPAEPLSVTVPVEEIPPVTLEGLNTRDTRVPGVIVRLADCLMPFRLAFTEAVV
jgi:hypothetical protein